MTPSEDQQLYQADRAAWMEQAAPRAAAVLSRHGRETIRATWPLLGDDYKAAIKTHLTPAQRDQFRAALSAPETATP